MAPTRTRIQVFARAPVAGAVKRRLIPALGAEAAAALHAELVDWALQRVTSAGLGPVELWGTPAPEAVFFRRCRERYGVTLHAQGRGELGARMAHALADGLCRASSVVLVGTDVPRADGPLLAAALDALNRADAVFAPAEDGGYGLVGLNRTVPGLFEGIDWGGPAVMAQSRARVQALGLRHTELATVWDVDRPADLPRLGALPDLPARIRRLLAEAGV